MRYRVVLADDHPVVREGLRRLLCDSQELQVIGEASDGHEALRVVRALIPDVLVLDLSMPGIDGIELTKLVSDEMPTVKVVALTMHACEEYAVRMLRAGARGFVGKGAPASEILGAIVKVAAGGSYLPPALLEVLPQRLAGARRPNAEPLETLSDREMQVLKLLAEGRTGREIGHELHLSVKTVDTYRARLLAKLNLETTADLIRFAVRHRVVEDAW